MSKDGLDGVILPTPRATAINEMKQPDASAISHYRLVNSDSSYPDVEFLFDEDSKSTLQAHHAILKARAPALLADAKQKKKAWVVQIGKGKSKPIPNHANAMYRVLVYIYTGEVDWSSLTPFQGVEVLNQAKLYNIAHLAQVCKKYIQDNITQQNVYEIMKYSHRLDVEEVKVLCIEFALLNTEFFTSSRAKDLGFDLYQEATAVLVKHYVKKSSPTISEKKVASNDASILDNFISVYNARGESGDMIFKLVGDKQVKVHKAMLANLSAELDTLIRNNNQSVVPTRPQYPEHQITYHRLTADAFEAMLKFIYYSDKNFSLVHATQLYLFAKDYKLTALVSTLDSVMSAADVDVVSVLFMLQIAFLELTEKRELQQTLKLKGLQFVVAHLDRIDFKPLDAMPALIGMSIVESVQNAVKKYHSNWDSMKANFTKETRPIPSSSLYPVGAIPSSPSSLNVTSPSRPSSPPPVPTGRKDDEESQLEESIVGSREKRQMRAKKESKRPLVEEGKEGKEKEGKEKEAKEKETKEKEAKAKDVKEKEVKEKETSRESEGKDRKKDKKKD